MRDAVAAIFADRANLAATLVDARGVVRSLRSLLGGVVHAACCFLYLAIWDVSCSVFVFLSFFLGVFCSLEVKKRELLWNGSSTLNPKLLRQQNRS